MLGRLLIHTVFSTKHREPVFQDLDLRRQLHAVMAGGVKHLGCIPIQIGGMSDHVHIFSTLSRTLCVANFVKEVKRSSTNWIQQLGDQYGHFHWQIGYGSFTVSESNWDDVNNYVLNQEHHHRKMTYQDEFRELLRRHKIEWDEEHVWD